MAKDMDDGKVASPPVPDKPVWTAQLPDDLKGNESFTLFKTIGDLGKAHIEAMGKLKELDGKTARVTELEGKLKDSILKLPENATQEEKEIYFSSLGRPESPEKYELPDVKLADGLTVSGPLKTWFIKTAFENGLTNAQASMVLKGYNDMLGQMVKEDAEAKKQEVQKAEEKLKTEWPGDQYRINLEITKRAFKKFANVEFDAFINETGIGNHPALIKFVYNVGKAMGEDTSPPGAQPRGKQELGMIYDKSPNP